MGVSLSSGPPGRDLLPPTQTAAPCCPGAQPGDLGAAHLRRALDVLGRCPLGRKLEARAFGALVPVPEEMAAVFQNPAGPRSSPDPGPSCKRLEGAGPGGSQGDVPGWEQEERETVCKRPILFLSMPFLSLESASLCPALCREEGGSRMGRAGESAGPGPQRDGRSWTRGVWTRPVSQSVGARLGREGWSPVLPRGEAPPPPPCLPHWAHLWLPRPPALWPALPCSASLSVGRLPRQAPPVPRKPVISEAESPLAG